MWQDRIYQLIFILFRRLFGLAMIVLSFILLIGLFTYDIDDPSFNSISSEVGVKNWANEFGSYSSDLMFQLLGLSSFLLCLVIFSFGSKMASKNGAGNVLFKIILLPFSLLCFSALFSLLPEPEWWPFNSLGGVNGAFIVEKFNYFPRIIEALIYLTLGLLSISSILEISLSDWIYFLRYTKITTIFISQKIFILLKNSVSSDLKFLPKKIYKNNDSDVEVEFVKHDNSDSLKETVADQEYLNSNNNSDYHEDEEEIKENENIESQESEDDKLLLKKQLKRIGKTIVRKNFKSSYKLPASSLLTDRSAENKNKKISKNQIDQQSQMLMKVLDDFGVKGSSLGAKVGPVVTLHEFEPAAGTKASRVIGLSDDIARSMSAVSARISVVPGKTSLGIELPNAKREMIFLKEMIESVSYQNSQALLPMILGKDIAGEPIIADLAKMPHLLIAGTTGSGKSVGLNVMILSLLYKLRPDECKFIMIDPKMLELSVYDGIPHLLSPVVTEPGKAVVALKWVVAEMEERYRLMSSFGVRNIIGYNERAEKAILSGETMSRKVQTGYNPEDGKPIIEEIEFEPKKLPFIVVIVDEMADLMLVAGKEIEGSIQRLAQMARAAGIHIIMATQRPSVDVITGVIKANFPTRISFQVTSRIDSRTILGVQGSEQLLGQGDMIFMSGGSKMMRVHGPFCSDSEIGDIVNFIKNQDLTEFDQEQKIEFEAMAQSASGGESGESSFDDGGGSDADLYQKAVAIVKRDKKPSISYVQRQLRIGYNRAAILIERMENEGIISAPNISGKREILEK